MQSHPSAPQIPRIVHVTNQVTVTDHVRALAVQSGVSVEVIPCETEADLIARCPHADALIVWVQPVTADVLAALPHLKVISRLGTGIDSIDIPAANRHGVVVTNVPDANSEEVATHTMALALATHRRLPSFDKSVRQGQWHLRPDSWGIRRPSKQTFGVIGYGKIGSRVAKLAAAMGFEVKVATRKPRPTKEVTAVELEELVTTSDIVSLHLPLSEKTHGMVSGKFLAKMKPGSALVNVSRGALVDHDALADALESGHLHGAALDVFAHEPLPLNSRLLQVENVLLTPHVAHLSQDSIHDALTSAYTDALSVLTGQSPRHPVNLG